MKFAFPFVCLFGLLMSAGCDHLAPAGNLGRYYQPYTGPQTNWPVSSNGGAFVTTFKGMPIYHGLPPMPYSIIGRMDRPNIPLFRLVACARYHKANAIFMSEQEVMEYHTDNGVTFGNNHVAFTTPSHTRAESRTEGTAYLIQIVGQPIPELPTPSKPVK